MASLRSISIIQPKKLYWEQRKEVEGKLTRQDLTYTLIAGEIKKNYCKIMVNVRAAHGNGPFQLNTLKEFIMVYGKDRVEKHYKSGHIRPERSPIGEPRANQLIAELQQQGYLQYVGKQHRDKAHPNIPEDGIKFYTFNKFKIIECEESKYFQQKIQKKTNVLEVKGKLTQKRCRALRQIYAQFGESTPFTYKMVTDIPAFYNKLADELTDPTKAELKRYYRAAAQNAESRDVNFIDTWNSLVRNNFISPYKIRAKDGQIKVRPGAYKVNMLFVRQCLSGANI
jgi:hypothetical protein